MISLESNLIVPIARNDEHQTGYELLDYLKSKKLRKGDEAWIVVDKDNWSDHDLAQLFKWALQSDSYGFALSNPKFEFWLLLHFEDVKRGEKCTNLYLILVFRLVNKEGGTDVADSEEWSACPASFSEYRRCSANL